MDDSPQYAPAEKASHPTRRDFLGALGGAAAAGILASDTARAQTGIPPFQDSFGNIAPAAGDALNAGVYPPPIYQAGSGPATVTPGYVQPNILMIMVDQLRSPRWLPTGGQAALDQMLPNIAFLRQHSFSFPNYYVAATNCTPSRATLLTGLYSQQTYVMNTQQSQNEPNLQPGIPTFGAALAQQAGYATCWIGKWHVSDLAPNESLPGANGPGDYGFTAGALNLPPNAALASPQGVPNQGNTGYNAAPYGSGTPNPSATVSSIQASPYAQLNDAAIANWFIDNWLPAAPKSKPWFASVSFVNPHDMSDFPLSFALAGSSNFSSPTVAGAPISGYQPPPVGGYPYNSAQPDQFVPPLNASLYPANGVLPPQWNESDSPANQPYGVQSGNGWGKPALQAYYQSNYNADYGSVLNTNGWFTFLNYYFWMQTCVDYHIGRVLTSLQASPFWSNTIVIFTSDHGDYGGSHGLHSKGGALYDEVINVPLFVSFPNMRPPFAPAPTSRVRPFVCSSVDIFAFLYTLALGNSAWRNNSKDPYTYLSGRESILDAILSTSPQQRRLSTFANANGPGFQPYILHTQDEYPQSVRVPCHAIAYRTVDTTVTMSVGGTTYYGGAKLGMYSYWICGGTKPDTTKAQQYEFYNYTAGNVGETGNGALVSSTQLAALPAQYLAAFNAIAQNELYVQYSQVQSAAQAGLTTYLAYISPKIGC